MNQYCVVVANGSKARFFTLEDPENPEVHYGPNLVKQADIVQQESELRDHEIWSDSKSGGNRGHGGRSHGYDDHRNQHRDEADKRFAHTIISECKRFSQKNAKIILVSQKRMLGHLRHAIQSTHGSLKPRELAKDLVKLNPIDLQEHLARENLIPERRAPALS